MAPWLALALIAGCRGSSPALYGAPEQGISAVVISGRFILPSGETPSGSMHINLESPGGRQAQVYRLLVAAGRPRLYQIEPDTYHLTPTRSAFGFHEETLKVRIAGRTYRAPFPRDIMRMAALKAKPRRIVTIGVLEARLSASLPGQEPVLRVGLDDSIETRRRIVQDLIRDMMNSAAPLEVRESAIAWSRPLEQTLNELLAETPEIRRFKPAP